MPREVTNSAFSAVNTGAYTTGIYRCMHRYLQRDLIFTRESSYTRKQLLLSARLSHRNSVRPSVCPSHGWISQTRCKL